MGISFFSEGERMVDEVPRPDDIAEDEEDGCLFPIARTFLAGV